MDLFKDKEFYLHMLLAVLICAKGINDLVFSGDSKLVILVVLPILMMIYLQKFRGIRNITSAQFISVVVILLLFFFQFARLSNASHVATVRTYFLFFLSFGLAPLLISNYKVNMEKLLSAVVLLSFVLSPFILRADFSGGDVRDIQAWLSVTYNLIPFIVASIFYLFWGDRKLLKIVSVINIFVCFPMMMTNATRGGMLIIAITPIACLFLKEKYKSGKVQKSFMIMSAGLLAVVVFSSTFLSFFTRIYLNTNSNFLNKIFSLDDVSDGRSFLYTDAINGFWESPIWGNGIASFWNYTMWPHNVFLQMMYENGLIIIIPFIFILFYGIRIILSIQDNKDMSLFLLFLILNSMIELLFSSYYWKKQTFWLFVWSTLYYIYYLKKYKLSFYKKSKIKQINY